VLLARGVAAIVMVLFVEFLSTAGLVVVTDVLIIALASVFVVVLAVVPLVTMVDTVVSSIFADTLLAMFCSS
jgi:hypothetical protein